MDFAHLLTDIYALVVVGAGAVAFIYLMLSYGLTFLKLGVMKPGKAKKKKGGEETEAESVGDRHPMVSVVMVAHNSSENLRQHLPAIMMQDYQGQNFEIVVVDYKSQDETSFVLQECKHIFPKLHIEPFQTDVNFFQGKKFPLSIGIQSASSDIVLLTEVDCEPDEHWISAIVAAYRDDDTKIVLAPTVLVVKKSLLGHLQQFDNLVRHVQMFAVAASRRAYTGIGTNLSYRRSFFFDCGGMSRHYVEPEGADDIFVNRNSRKGNTAVTLAPEAIVRKEAESTFSQWSYHRRQRASTRCYYSFLQRLRIVMRPLMLVLFYAACAYMFVLPSVPWVIPAALLLLKLVWQIVCVAYAQKRFSLQNYHWFAPLFELYFLVADTILAIITLHPKRCNP